jgi:hypothetical protein
MSAIDSAPVAASSSAAANPKKNVVEKATKELEHSRKTKTVKDLMDRYGISSSNGNTSVVHKLMQTNRAFSKNEINIALNFNQSAQPTVKDAIEGTASLRYIDNALAKLGYHSGTKRQTAAKQGLIDLYTKRKGAPSVAELADSGKVSQDLESASAPPPPPRKSTKKSGGVVVSAKGMRKHRIVVYVVKDGMLNAEKVKRSMHIKDKFLAKSGARLVSLDTAATGSSVVPDKAWFLEKENLLVTFTVIEITFDAVVANASSGFRVSGADSENTRIFVLFSNKKMINDALSGVDVAKKPRNIMFVTNKNFKKRMHFLVSQKH